MRRIVGRVGVGVMIATLLFATVSWPVATYASPTNAKIRAKQAEAATANQKLQDLSNSLELKQTDLQAVDETLNATRAKIVATENQLAEAQTQLAESQTRLADRAEAIYRSGSVDMLAVLLGTTDFQDFVTRLDMLNRIETSDADLVAQVTTARDSVSAARTALVNREAEEIALRTEAAARAAEVASAVARQNAYVRSLSAQVKQLVKQEQERQAAAAAEAARQAEAQASSHPDTRPSDAGSLGSPHPAAVAVAKRYLGVPYLWGGTTPNGFDCSGLVQYCYAQIGISLPRTARAQFTVGQFIPRSRTDLLEAGDLVFFGYGGDANQIHHVGMYVGGGIFINAPATGDVVKYASLTDRIRTSGDYVGAIRP